MYGDADKKEATMAGLKSSEGFLRRMLAAKLNLRHTPELTFILDESIEYGMYMSRRIAELGISSDDDDDETGEKTEEAGTLPENDEDKYETD